MTFKPIDVYTLPTGIYSEGERTREAGLVALHAGAKKGWRGYLASQRNAHRVARGKPPMAGGVTSSTTKRPRKPRVSD